MKSILDKSFRYTPSHETDLRKRFGAEHEVTWSEPAMTAFSDMRAAA